MPVQTYDWIQKFNFAFKDYDFDSGGWADHIPGRGWVALNQFGPGTRAYKGARADRTWAGTALVTRVTLIYDVLCGNLDDFPGPPPAIRAFLLRDGGTITSKGIDCSSGSGLIHTFDFTDSFPNGVLADEFDVAVNSDYNYAGVCSGEATLIGVIVEGLGENPFAPDATNHGGLAVCPFNFAGKLMAKSKSPIDLRYGEKLLDETDLTVQTPAGPLAFSRGYRQSKLDDSHFRYLGLGWTHNHRYLLETVAGTPNTIVVRLAGGSEVYFTETQTDHYAGDPGSASVIDKVGGDYVLTAADQSVYTFVLQSGSLYRLQTRAWPNGEVWTYAYDGDDRLVEVEDGYGRKLQFSYVDNPNNFDNGKLWRVGDHTAAGLDTGSPSGRYVEFGYVSEKDDGQEVTGGGHPYALLASVQDVRGQTWTYDYYGQDSGESADAQLNFLTEIISPDVLDTDDDDVPDTPITLQRLAYTLSGSAISAITQERGIVDTADPLLETVYTFQAGGENVTEEVTAGLTTIHRFANGVYAGTEDPGGNLPQQNFNDRYRPEWQFDANGNASELRWSDDGKQLDRVVDALGGETAFVYDDAERLLASQDAESRLTEYAYDADRRQPTVIVVKDDNLVVDGGMEEADGSSGWEGVNSPTTNTRSDSQVHSGSYARHVEADNGEGIIQKSANAWAAQAGRTYFVRARVYVVSGSVKLEGWNGTSAVFSAESNRRDIWSTLQVTYQPTGAASLRLRFLATEDDTEFYVDSVAVGAVGPLLVNGSMETDDWSAVNGATLTHWARKVDRGDYSRHVAAGSGDGIEQSSSWNLADGKAYAISARVYPVSGAVKFKLSGVSGVETTSQSTGDWETLSLSHTASGTPAVKLQALAEGGSAAFYLDSIEVREDGLLLMRIDMEADGGWSSVGSPSTHEHWLSKVDSGDYAYFVEAGAAGRGLEKTLGDLVKDRTYIALARVYVVDGTVKMQVSGASGFEATSQETDAWESLYARFTPDSAVSGAKVQFLAEGGAANFYVDSVHVLDSAAFLRCQAFVYDGLGRTVAEHTLRVSDAALAAATERQYYPDSDSKGLLSKVIQGDLSGGLNDFTTDYLYDSAGRVIQVGQSATFGSCVKSYTLYDEAGNVVASICNYEPGQGSAPTTVAEAIALYDDQNPHQNRVTTHEYDAMGRRVKTTTLPETAFARTDQTVYDALNRVVRTVQNVDTTGVDDNVAGWVWDANDGRWEDDSAAAIPHGADNTQNIISDTVYNERGGVRLRRDVLGNVTLYGYDDAGRLVKTVRNAYDEDYNNDYSGTGSDPDLSAYAVDQNAGEDQDILSTQEYDAAGNLVKTVDVLGRVNLTAYDALNRPVRAVQNFYDDGIIDTDLDNWVWDAGDDRWEDGSDNPIPHGEGNDRNHISATVYDVAGRVSSVRDVDGNVTLMGYDSLGRQVKTVRNAATPGYDLAADPDLSEYSPSTAVDQDLISQTVYDDQGRVLYTEDLNGKQTRSGYDTFGRQTVVVQNYDGSGLTNPDPTDWVWDDQAARWEDDDDNPIPHGNDDRNLIRQTFYDDEGRLQRNRDVVNRWTLYGYDEQWGGQTRVIRNANNPEYVEQQPFTDFDLSAYSSTDPGPDQDVISDTLYDDLGRVLSTIDPRGNVTRSVYDVLGRRVRTIRNYVAIAADPADWVWNGSLDRWEDGSSNPISHGSDNDQNLISDTAYDVAGRVSSVRDVDGNVTTSSYDRAGRRVQTVVNAVDGFFESGKPDEDLISSSEYNRGGQVVTTTDARGTKTTFAYDNAGRRLTVTRAADTPWGTTDYTCYDKRGRVLRVIRNWIDDETSPNAKDGNGDWLFQPAYHGRFNDRDLISAYVYDAAGRRVTAVQNVYFDGVVDTDLSNWAWANDQWEDGSSNAIPHGEDNDRNLISTTTYAKDGQVVSTRDALGRQTYHVYDALRRLVRVVQNWVDNGDDPADWVWNSGAGEWRESDNTTAIDHGTDEDENILVDVTLDKAGQRTALRDPRGNQTTYDYDLLGRRTELTNPLSKTWQTAYEEVSGTLRTTLTNPLSQAVQRDTDRLGRLSSISYLGENPKVTPDVSFAYDRAGNRTLMSETVDGGSSYERHTHFHYDDARRLTEVEFDTDGDDDVDEAVEYAYEVGGRRTKLVLPDGKVIQYRYDERGQLVGLTDWDDQRARFAYDLAGRLIGIERSNDLRSRYAYDAAGRLQLLRHSYQHNTTLAEFAYTVDLLGNRTQVTETLRQPNDTLITKTIDYAYDGLSRLLSADYSTGEAYAYEYDVAGNRTKKTVDGTPTNYTYNAANQITSGGITYDDAGRMVSDGANSLTWDRADRLLSYNGVENLYNGLGQRVSQTVSSVVTEYLLDMQPGLAVVLREQTGSNDPIHFLHGPRGLHAHNDGTTEANWRWPLLDGLGSVRSQVDAGLVDDVGEYTVDALRHYAPYGEPFGALGQFDTSYGFTGEPTDGSDLVYLRARYMNPGIGTFLSLDSVEGHIGNAMRLNRYNYGRPNPIVWIDPSGAQEGGNVHIRYCSNDPALNQPSEIWCTGENCYRFVCFERIERGSLLPLTPGGSNVPINPFAWLPPQGGNDVQPVHPNDVNQNQLSNCYFEAAIAAIALQNPQLIYDAIVHNADGSFTVSFYRPHIGIIGTTPYYVHRYRSRDTYTFTPAWPVLEQSQNGGPWTRVDPTWWGNVDLSTGPKGRVRVMGRHLVADQ